MCDPVTLGYLALGASGISAVSSIQSGRQQEAIADYQADQAEADAETAKQAAQIEGDKHREKVKRLAASARAAIAAAGFSLDSVTAEAINFDIIKRGEEDALINIKDAGDAASRLRAQADALRIGGNNAKTAGYAQAASSLLGTYAQAKGGWYGGASAAPASGGS